nr:NAD(P)/FAD-dependent oxidoreductase [uncultured Rhodococcus sp.]
MRDNAIFDDVITTDIAIIGAGPVGLFAAYYAGFRGKTTTVIDALPVVGGQVSAMYPEKQIYDVAGFPAVTGRDLIDRLTQQTAPFDPHYLLGQHAQHLELVEARDEPFPIRIRTSSNTTVAASAAIIACGVGGFAPRPMPDDAGVHPQDVDHFVTDPSLYRGRDAVVIGGGDSALDWALSLVGVASSVTVVHRRSSFRAHEHSVHSAKAAGVRLMTDARVVSSVYSPALTSVAVDSGPGGREELSCSRIVAALGFTARLGPVLDWGLDIEDNRRVRVDTRMSTSIPRVFSAGDITTYDGKVPLIAVGFGEAATAVSNACALMDPTAALFGGHSTEQAEQQLVGGSIR